MDSFYLRSFWDLNSTRYYDRGPIPHDKIVEYGYHISLDADMINIFVALIRAMDAGYRGWIQDEIDRQQPKQKKVKKP